MDDPFQEIVQEADTIKLRLTEIEDALDGAIDHAVLRSILLVLNSLKMSRGHFDLVLEILGKQPNPDQLR